MWPTLLATSFALPCLARVSELAWPALLALLVLLAACYCGLLCLLGRQRPLFCHAWLVLLILLAACLCGQLCLLALTSFVLSCLARRHEFVWLAVLVLLLLLACLVRSELFIVSQNVVENGFVS